jgi:cysteine-rich repeat protein
VAAACGNGTQEAREQCDDGNTSNSDACLNTCIAASCGDGYVRTNVEQCDDGNNVNNDGCQGNCMLPVCQDGDDTDSDNDGTPDCTDNCPADPDKSEPGVCGCGVADADQDNDNVVNCNDNCPNDPNTNQADSDDDDIGDACDACPNDPENDADQDGVCGDVDECEAGDDTVDSDEDGVADACDPCPNDPDDDADFDGVCADEDACPDDADKSQSEGDCGCGISETDSDQDGIKDCLDNAPYNPNQDQSDGDGDGVGDAAEKGPDGTDDQYDGNGDGIPDSQQNNAASLPVNYGAEYLTMSTDADCDLLDVVNIPMDEIDDLPDGINFPFGIFEFVLFNCDFELGISKSLTFDLPEGAQVNTYFKYGPTPNNNEYHWYEFIYDGATGVDINDTSMTLYFVDGQRGDDDLMVNGIIIDQGAPACDGGDCPGLTSGSSSGGCFIETLFPDFRMSK